MNSGLANNGGSRTIVRSANTLRKMGHDIIILNTKPIPAYNWDTIDVPVIAPKTSKNIPEADIIIATAYSTVRSTMEASKCRIKAHWIRGYESWSNTENQIREVFNQPTLKIVNSICMHNKLLEYGVTSEIILPGYDFEELYPTGLRDVEEKIVIGGLYSEGKKRKSKRTEWIFEAVRNIKEDIDIELVMFGADGIPPKDSPVDYFIPNPDIKTKSKIYNICDIWLAPTENDSLHLCAAEAMQTCCAVVGTDAQMNGMKDYLFDLDTGIISSNNVKDFENCVRFLIDRPWLRQELGNAARSKILMLGDRKDNMNKLIKYLDNELELIYSDS